MEATLDANMFANLMESVAQMDEIVRGERQPSREFHIDAVSVKESPGDRAVSQPGSSFSSTCRLACFVLEAGSS